MSPAVELIGRRQSRGAGTDDGNFLSGANLGNPGLDQTAVKGVFNDGQLVVVAGHRVAVQVTGASLFTGRGANSASELRKVIGDAQTVIGLLPVALVDQVVPFGDQVVQRTAGHRIPEHHARLTEGHAAVHAPGGLLLLLLPGQQGLKLVPVANPLLRGDHMAILTLIFHKSSGFSHLQSLLRRSWWQHRRLRSELLRC